VRRPDAQPREPDRDRALPRLVVLGQPAERGDPGRGGLRVRPAARAELAPDALPAAERVRAYAGSAAGAGGWGGLRRVDGEEAGGAAGGDGRHARDLRGARVRLLDGEEGWGVDEGAVGRAVEAELAERVVAEGEGAPLAVGRERVVVAGGDASDLEAAQRDDFVALVVAAWWPRLPC